MAVIVVIVFVGIAFVGIVAAIAVPSLIRARVAANESSAIGTLRSISRAEESYFGRNKRYGTLSELARESLVDQSLTDGAIRNSYVIREVGVSATGFEFSAAPADEKRITAGDRSFNVIQDNVIRYREGLVAPTRMSGTPIGN